MAFPIIQMSAEALPANTKRFRVFISYSHNDTETYSKTFIKFFTSQLLGTPQLGIKSEHVYYDRAQLNAGDDWHESIQQALDESEYFVFLVSINSIDSKYCMTRELYNAAKRGLPIIPVVLEDCPWEKLPVPADSRNRTLGQFDALPLDNNSRPRPISAWGHRATAWTKVVEGLTARMLRDRTRAARPDIMIEPMQGAQTRLSIAPLLPYFCNQVDVVNGFRNRVRSWNRDTAEGKALIVLLRGLQDDSVPRFSSLLCKKYLEDALATRNERLLPSRPFAWPFKSGQTFDIQEGTMDMMSALSESLAENSFQLANAFLLGQWLAGLHGIRPIVTTLPPDDSKENTAAGLRILLTLLEQCPSDARLDRLAIFIIIENEALVAERNLSKTLSLVGYQRSHLADLMPLQEIDEHDIRNWYRAHVETICPINEEQLLKKVFIDEPGCRLRMGQFDTRVRPILGL